MNRHAIAVAAIAAAASPAWAQECGPLKEIASLDTTSPAGSSVMTVQAGFNGQSRPMLVSTGNGISMMREGALEGLGLHGIQNSSVTMLSSGGGASRSFVEVADFSLGAIRSQRMQFQVAPGSGGDGGIAGTIGGDVMALYDVEIDPAGHKLNFFAKDHCPGHVLYWHPTAVAVLPVTTQLATGDRSRTGYHSYIEREKKVYVPVTLDGKEFPALISTGAQESTMPAATAKFQFGVTYDSPGSTVVQPSPDSDPSHAIFVHVFPTLTFDTVTVTNAHFVVYPDMTGARDPNNSTRTDMRIKRVDDNINTGAGISIGMDVLRRLRLFIAFSEKKLYITPATAPAGQSAANAPVKPEPVTTGR